jgi:carbon-monoxide dehydrogenase medium subunit
MYPAAFDYSAPATIEEAVRILSEQGENAKLLAGGHSLLPLMKLRFAQPAHVVDLRRIPTLRGVRRDGATLAIGSMMTYAELTANADVRDFAGAVADATALIGDPQVRNRGTIGGSIAHADPNADLPAVMLALGASIDVAGSAGRRSIAVDDFFVDLFTTALAPGELITDIRIPIPSARAGSAYIKHAQPASRFALVGVAARVEFERMSDRVRGARVAMTGLGSTPMRAIAVEEALAGRSLNAETIRAAAGRLTELPDVSERAYTIQLARVGTEQALTRAAERAQ